MTILYHSDQFLLHKTGQHPEQPARLESIHQRLDQLGLTEQCESGPIVNASDEQLERIHPPSHRSAIETLAQQGGGRIDADTVVSSSSAAVARLASGTACDAVRRILSGSAKNSLCLSRPPGHHALPSTAMGFCLFNNVAVAAMEALAQGLDRVLIIDWDVHHGNGTQDIFWRNEQVAFLSIHRWPFWPGSGDEGETGEGPGLGFTRNLPTAFGTPSSNYLDRFRSAIESFATAVRPQLILLSAGFDAHRLDPIGSLGLDAEDFRELTRVVQAAADEHCQGRIVSLLEGGYHLEALAESVAVHLEELLRVG